MQKTTYLFATEDVSEVRLVGDPAPIFLLAELEDLIESVNKHDKLFGCRCRPVIEPSTGRLAGFEADPFDTLVFVSAISAIGPVQTADLQWPDMLPSPPPDGDGDESADDPEPWHPRPLRAAA